MDLEVKCVDLYNKCLTYKDVMIDNHHRLSQYNYTQDNTIKNMYLRLFKDMEELIGFKNFKGFKKLVIKRSNSLFPLSMDVDYVALILRVHNFKSLPRYIKTNIWNEYLGVFVEAKKLKNKL